MYVSAHVRVRVRAHTLGIKPRITHIRGGASTLQRSYTPYPDFVLDGIFENIVDTERALGKCVRE